MDVITSCANRKLKTAVCIFKPPYTPPLQDNFAAEKVSSSITVIAHGLFRPGGVDANSGRKR
jgi:hypothetical protein